MNKFEERESITLENNGQKIFGVLHLPLKRPLTETPCPVVLMCHGLAGDKTGRYRVYVMLSEMLVKLGIASFRFDFRGSGDSEGNFSDMTIESEVEDALKSLEFLEKHPLFNKEKIGVFGRSIGGTIAILAAERYKKIKSIVTWAPLSDGDQWLEKWKQLHSEKVSDELRAASMRINGQIPGQAFFSQLFSLQMSEKIKALHGIPFLHIHGEQDVVVVTEHASRYAQFRESAKGESKFIRLPKSDHDFSDPEEQKIALKETCDWFKEFL